MRPSELGMWAAFYRVDPWGEKRADLRAGIVASTIANVNRGRGVRAFSPIDFMPYEEREQPSLAKQLMSFLKGRPSAKKKGSN